MSLWLYALYLGILVAAILVVLKLFPKRKEGPETELGAHDPVADIRRHQMMPYRSTEPSSPSYLETVYPTFGTYPIESDESYEASEALLKRPPVEVVTELPKTLADSSR